MKNILLIITFLLAAFTTMTGQSVDCGISVFLEPEKPSDGYDIIQATLRNYGDTPINTCDIYVVINGITKRPYRYIGPSLAPGRRIDLYITSHLFNKNGTYELEVYTANPNGVTDTNTSNDTLKTTLKGELDLESNDAGIVSILAPSVISEGYKLVRVKLKNFGIDPIDNVEIAWRVNGVDQASYFYTNPPLRSRGEIDLFVGSYEFVEGIDYTISSRVVMPNGKADEKPSNDRAVREY